MENNNEGNEAVSFASYDELEKEIADNLQDGEIFQRHMVTISGQIMSKRSMGKRLTFYGIKQLDDKKFLQLIWGDDIEEIQHTSAVVKETGEKNNETKLGDIIQVTGYPGKSRKGRFSIFISSIKIIEKEGDRFTPERPEDELIQTGVRQKKCDVNNNNHADDDQIDGNDSQKVESDQPYPPLCQSMKRQKKISTKASSFVPSEGDPSNTNIKCRFGSSCPFRHYYIGNEEERYKVVLKEKYKKVLEEEHDEGDPFSGDNKQSKMKRAVLLVKWLIDTFGKDYLSSGTGIIEVAGGKGEVSFELCIANDIPCTLVEPRSHKLSKKQLRLTKDKNLFNHIQCCFDGSFVEKEEQKHLVENCSLIVGLHPDQATEPIVDMALKWNKPFAVVPCCVFPNLFPDRRIKDEKGEEKPVTSYFDLLQFLKDKDPSIQIGYLNMNGRNKILYRGTSK